ncbi:MULTISPECIES: glucose-1-phosphate cytidylyltransferase [Pseudomonas]|uniref:Glucose-1-phosphate cytidylyltransferase n=1 Tax=Pseudomonas kuykendallii TaxID=1007099 RepID=A0A2W5EXY3_9PSED|nr:MULTISPECIES: glucose-1-phosphate cytidylyltransferase [Pseudomonas]MCQ4271225.1 glucose-1-phosphate cytidylyltransferase [Pseudomonas kuykendallii]PZP24996.1 MAG: glucose-1-phosphate cytidylyltransferase [Pseudomonas kuykendallii]SDW66477.1 glucose-1-phosphate cytidylyltransferase [Pseudomonas kuykendallii]
MKVALFAGGFGTRLSEETSVRPKPMVEIGGRPILWHIMKMYAAHGMRDFVVLGGYKVEYIRDYFLNYRGSRTDFTIDLKSGGVEWLQATTEDWRVTVLDTGADSMTGGRLKRARHLLGDDTFCLTYGDGVSDVDITKLIKAHRESNKWCTLTAVTQPGRYGALRLSEDLSNVEAFREKGAADGGLINGGFFVCEPEVFDLIDDDQTVWENEPMDRLVAQDKLGSYHHSGYWQSMDSLRDKQVLEDTWAKGAPWKTWSN